jgi:hypothetical protein
VFGGFLGFAVAPALPRCIIERLLRPGGLKKCPSAQQLCVKGQLAVWGSPLTASSRPEPSPPESVPPDLCVF